MGGRGDGVEGAGKRPLMEETLTSVSVFSFPPQMYILGLDFMGGGDDDDGIQGLKSKS